MPTYHTVVLAHDPMWFLKFLLVALLLAVPLTIGAHVVKARRNTIVLTFMIALGALLAGHFAAPVPTGGWELLFPLAASLATLYLGIRYILVTGVLASLSMTLVIMSILVAGLLVVSQVTGVA